MGNDEHGPAYPECGYPEYVGDGEYDNFRRTHGLPERYDGPALVKRDTAWFVTALAVIALVVTICFWPLIRHQIGN